MFNLLKVGYRNPFLYASRISIPALNLSRIESSRSISKKSEDDDKINDIKPEEKDNESNKINPISHTFWQKQNQIRKLELKNLPEWQKRSATLKKRYGEWKPTHKLSREEMNNVRQLKLQVPSMKTIDLAGHFGISPEAIRRILHSKWVPNSEENERLLRRGQELKRESEERRSKTSQDISLARKRMTYNKSVNLNEIQLVSNNNHKMANITDKLAQTSNTFKKNGKVLYDSNINHSFYKNKKRRNMKSMNRLNFYKNTGDIID